MRGILAEIRADRPEHHGHVEDAAVALHKRSRALREIKSGDELRAPHVAAPPAAPPAAAAPRPRPRSRSPDLPPAKWRPTGPGRASGQTAAQRMLELRLLSIDSKRKMDQVCVRCRGGP